MSTGWQITNYPTTATAASVSQAAPGSGLQNRCRSFSVGATGDGVATASGIIKFVIRDGATGVGTIIWAGAVLASSTGSTVISKTDLDLRASPGNALTIESTGGGATGTQLFVDMQGDIVTTGYPSYATIQGI